MYTIYLSQFLRETEKDNKCALELDFSGDHFVLNRAFLEANEFELLGTQFQFSNLKAESVVEMDLEGLWEQVPELPKPQGTSSGLGDLLLGIIIAGGTLAVIIIVVCCYCFCCRKPKDSRVSQGDTQSRTSSATRNDGDWSKKESS